MVERFDNEIAYFEDTYCDTEISEWNQSLIENECFNKKFCKIKFEIDSDPPFEKCKGEYKGSRKELDFDKYALFLEFECNIETIRLDGYGEITRTKLSNIVMICDALICAWFVCHTAM